MAAFCTTAAFVPQVIRVVRLKSTGDISRASFLVFSLGMAVWMFHGFRIDPIPVILANGVTSVLALTVVALKLSYNRASRQTGS